MSAFWLTLLLAADALTGTLRTTGPALNRAIMLRVDDKDVSLSGDLLEELGHIASARVEVLGHREQDADGGGSGRFVVEGYRILGVSGFDTAPMVGLLVAQAGEVLALQDGDGSPIPLNVSPASRTRLAPQVGAKIWVYGKKLLSGELKVQVFGFLRPVAKTDTKAKQPAGAPSPQEPNRL